MNKYKQNFIFYIWKKIYKNIQHDKEKLVNKEKKDDKKKLDDNIDILIKNIIEKINKNEQLLTHETEFIDICKELIMKFKKYKKKSDDYNKNNINTILFDNKNKFIKDYDSHDNNLKTKIKCKSNSCFAEQIDFYFKKLEENNNLNEYEKKNKNFINNLICYLVKFF